jgi:hypothetical protein
VHGWVSPLLKSDIKIPAFAVEVLTIKTAIKLIVANKFLKFFIFSSPSLFFSYKLFAYLRLLKYKICAKTLKNQRIRLTNSK